MVINIPTDGWSLISAPIKLNILRLAFNASYEELVAIIYLRLYTSNLQKSVSLEQQQQIKQQ